MISFLSSKLNRKSIRLKDFDYSQEGAYFITICCYNMTCWFGKIETSRISPNSSFKEGVMVLNDFGNIAHTEWIKLADHCKDIETNVVQIMPNHMHGIILKEIKNN